MIPPPLETFTSPREHPLNGFFRLAGEFCHLSGAPTFLIAPQQDEAIGFWKAGQHALRLLLQRRAVNLFFVGWDSARLRNGFVLRVRPIESAQTLAVIVVDLVAGKNQQPVWQAGIPTVNLPHLAPRHEEILCEGG